MGKSHRVINLVKANVVAYMITAIFFIGAALLLTYTSLSESAIPIIVIITTLISVMLAGYDMAKVEQSKGWMWGMLSGFFYGLILLIIGCLVAKDFSFDKNTLTLLLVVAGGGALGGIIGINKKK